MVKMLLSLVAVCLLEAKTPFLLQDIRRYADENNPFFSAIVLQNGIATANERYYKGAYDTDFTLRLEEKNYPLSQGTFTQASLTQPLQSGIDASISYRKANGIQEYNNIKTSSEGELLANVTLFLNNLWLQTSARDVAYETARLDTTKTRHTTRQALFSFYFDAMQSYYRLLFASDTHKNRRRLLSQAKLRYDYIQTQIKNGTKPPIDAITAKRFVLQSKRQTQQAYSDFLQAQNEFATLLGLNQATFTQQYDVPSLPDIRDVDLRLERYLQKAYAHRGDLAALWIKQKQTALRYCLNKLERYPNVRLSANVVQDLAYEERGYKLQANLSFALWRTKYEAMDEKLRRIRQQNAAQIATIKRTIRLRIENLVQSLRNLSENIVLLQEELELAIALEEAQQTRYEEGSATLFELNRQTIQTLQTRQNLLQTRLQFFLTYSQLLFESATIEEALRPTR